MKTIMIILLWSLSASAFAALSADGPYIGAQLGYAVSENSHAKDNLTALRPYLGYRLNDNFAIEAGYEDFTSELSGGDLLGKAILPFQHGFSLFIMAGGAYVMQDIQTDTYENKANRILPAAGIGAGYNITKNLAADLSWLHIIGLSDVENIDYVAAGLSITF